MIDAGGTYTGSAYPATATVNGVATLEGVAPTLSYFRGTFTSVSQLTGLTPLAGASAAGNYTVEASFAGSTDYYGDATLTTFTIGQIAPTVSVSDAGGPYTSSAYPATATVNGGATLEGVAPTLSYFSGTFTNVGQLAGLTPLSGAPALSAATRWKPPSPAAPITPAAMRSPPSPSLRRPRPSALAAAWSPPTAASSATR